MKRYFKPSLVAAMALALSVTAAACSPPPKEEPLYIEIRGYIDEAMLDKLKVVNWGAVDYIVLSSHGGDIPASVKLAEKLAASRKPVLIADLCAWSCILIGLSKSNQVEVRPDAIVIFGETASSRLAAAEGRPGESLAGLRAEAELEAAWLKRNGVDSRMLYAPLLAMEPGCFIIVEDATTDPDNEGEVYLGVTRTGWIPPDAAVKRLGFNGGAGATSPEQVEASFQRIRANRTAELMSFANGEHLLALPAADLRAKLRTLKHCEPGPQPAGLVFVKPGRH